MPSLKHFDKNLIVYTCHHMSNSSFRLESQTYLSGSSRNNYLVNQTHPDGIKYHTSHPFVSLSLFLTLELCLVLWIAKCFVELTRQKITFYAVSITYANLYMVLFSKSCIRIEFSTLPKYATNRIERYIICTLIE